MDKRNSLVTFAVVAGLIVLAMGFHALGWLTFLENGIASALGPVARPLNQVTNFLNPRQTDGLSREELVAQLEQARSENRQLLADNAQLKEVGTENETLRRY